MIGLTTVLWTLSALFALFLLARSLGLKVCAACAAVFTTWVGLLALLVLEKEVDPLMIGIFMGGSVVGVTYFLQEKLPEDYQLFTYPFLITFFSLAYILLADVPAEWGAYILLASIWTLFVALFSVRKNTQLRGLAKRIIECCKNW